MEKALKEKIKKDSNKASKRGEGFSDARGYIPESGPIPKHNGLNVNNDPQHQREKEIEKQKNA